jgi:hypothetical protein
MRKRSSTDLRYLFSPGPHDLANITSSGHQNAKMAFTRSHVKLSLASHDPARNAFSDHQNQKMAFTTSHVPLSLGFQDPARIAFSGRKILNRNSMKGRYH